MKHRDYKKQFLSYGTVLKLRWTGFHIATGTLDISCPFQDFSLSHQHHAVDFIRSEGITSGWHSYMDA